MSQAPARPAEVLAVRVGKPGLRNRSQLRSRSKPSEAPQKCKRARPLVFSNAAPKHTPQSVAHSRTHVRRPTTTLPTRGCRSKEGVRRRPTKSPSHVPSLNSERYPLLDLRLSSLHEGHAQNTEYIWGVALHNHARHRLTRGRHRSRWPTRSGSRPSCFGPEIVPALSDFAPNCVCPIPSHC